VIFSKQYKRQGGKKMKRFATLTVLVLLTMLLLAGTASANLTGAVYGWANSNRSGEVAIVWDGGPLLRNVPGQLTHTAFQLNTNSCASCHMTHTAVGTNLLIQATTQDTCMACHDGTIGFLNVNAPATGTTSGAGMGGSVAAGTFGIDTLRTPSMHNTVAGVTLSGAPGGNRAGITEQAGASWSTSFTCASCHAPHGSHSIRLLHANPNNVALRNIAAPAAGVAGGRWSPNARSNVLDVGTGVYGFSVANAVYSPARQVWVYRTVHAAAYTAPWVAGYTAAVTTAAYGRLGAGWTRIYHEAWNPNLNGFANPTTATGWTAANVVNILNRYFTINFATGEVIQTERQRGDLINFLQNAPFNLSAADAAVAPLNIDVARGLRVRAQANTHHLANLVAGARQVDFINPATYDAPAYNLFCAACHTDYLPTISAGADR
jgi:predicted CXXCH cytochrome family protein